MQHGPPDMLGDAMHLMMIVLGVATAVQAAARALPAMSPLPTAATWAPPVATTTRTRAPPAAAATAASAATATAVTAATATAVTAATATPHASRVRVNVATVEELLALPGIGPKRAALIVEARAKRPFVRAVDLRRVRGLGPKGVRRLAPLLDFSLP